MPDDPPPPPLLDRPREYLKPDATWPNGSLIDSAPPRARLVHELAQRLHQARDERSLRIVGADVGLSHGTIDNFLSGDTWGSARTIATLESYFESRVSGDEHREFSFPHEYVIPGQDWPDGVLISRAPSEARLAQAVTLRLKKACGKRPVDIVAKNAGVSLLAVQDIYNGTSWGDLATIARLERYLDYRLWGDEHLRTVPPPPLHRLRAEVAPRTTQKHRAPRHPNHPRHSAKTPRIMQRRLHNSPSSATSQSQNPNHRRPIQRHHRP